MKLKEKMKAIQLRKKGYSMLEISRALYVSKSTVSLWSKDIQLSDKAKKRLLTRIKLGQYNSVVKKRTLVSDLHKRLREEVKVLHGSVALTKEMKKILCAIIYWCEGTKNYHTGVTFTNSDPFLTRFFMNLLIEGYDIKRSAFSARLHLHEYHSIKKQENFWQKILGLKPSQFRSAYQKPHTGKRYRDNYPGCISLRYYDSILARKLMFLAQAFTGGMV